MRATVAGLWLVGAALACFTAPRAWQRTGVVLALPFIAVALGGIELAVAVLRANHFALAISTVLLGAQIFGVIGSAWELVHDVGGSKARELRRLGFDPKLGVALNLLYSAVATAVLAWLVIGWLAARRRRVARWDTTSKER